MPHTDTVMFSNARRRFKKAIRENNPTALGRINVQSLDINAEIQFEKEKMPALHYATKKGFRNLMVALLTAGCDVNRVTQAGGATALHAACGYNGVFMSVNMMKELLAHGAERNYDDEQPIRQGRVSLVSVLCEHGADVNVANDLGDSTYVRCETKTLGLGSHPVFTRC